MEFLGFSTEGVFMPPAAKGRGPLETRNDDGLLQRRPIGKGCRTQISQMSLMKAFSR
jgi:hypothetical protein